MEKEAIVFAVLEEIIGIKLKDEFDNLYDNLETIGNSKRKIDLENAILNLIEKVKFEYYKVGKISFSVADSTNFDA